MSWNYRVVRHGGPNGYEYFGLHEVYYDKKDKIFAWAPNAEAAGSSVEELVDILKRQLSAAEKAFADQRLVLEKKDLPE